MLETPEVTVSMPFMERICSQAGVQVALRVLSAAPVRVSVTLDVQDPVTGLEFGMWVADTIEDAVDNLEIR